MRLSAHILILVLAALLMLVFPSISPVVVLLGSGLAGILVFALLPGAVDGLRPEEEKGR